MGVIKPAVLLKTRVLPLFGDRLLRVDDGHKLRHCKSARSLPHQHMSGIVSKSLTSVLHLQKKSGAHTRDQEGFSDPQSRVDNVRCYQRLSIRASSDINVREERNPTENSAVRLLLHTDDLCPISAHKERGATKWTSSGNYHGHSCKQSCSQYYVKSLRAGRN